MNYKHGHKRKSGASKLYRIHHNIVQRCTRKSCPAYKDYGGRGIKIYEPWLDFNIFLKDIPSCPQNGYTLDRINNNGNYEPNNIRWATRIEQANNKRNNRYVEINGITKTLRQWCRELNRNYWTVKTRINQGKKSPIYAILTPTNTVQMAKL